MGSMLPERYRSKWRIKLVEHLDGRLVPSVRVLDIGSGRTPAIPINARPAGCEYVGLDIDVNELNLAPEGGYSRTIVADALQLRPDLLDQFDVVVTWQVLEHVLSTQQAVDCMYAYLRPGGIMVSMLSGRNSLFAIPNRVIPHRMAKFILARLLKRDPDTVFPAVYDSCTHRELAQCLARWRSSSVISLWRGADYLAFSPMLQRAYLRGENLLADHAVTDFATHYLVIGTK